MSKDNCSRLSVRFAWQIRVRHTQPNVRLVGFNAPETRRAVCEAERELGGKATRRLGNLVREGNLDFASVACFAIRGERRARSLSMSHIASRNCRPESLPFRPDMTAAWTPVTPAF